jgi:superfamily II DNA or RNA helicase
MIVGKRFAPRPHQVDAITAAVAELAIADRATLVMASGSGKTATGVWAAGAQFGNSRAGIIVCFFPSLALIRQTIPVWLDEQPWGVSFRFLAVCSDRSVVDDDISPDDMPYPTTTDASEVAQFACGVGVRVIFATYHSSEAVSAALREIGRKCDLALFDEAHKTAGSPGPAFAGPLSDEVFPCKKRLFMTATPRVTNRKKRNKDGDAQVVSMDDESIYGRVAYRLSFREAAARKLICTYKVLVSVITTAELGAEPAAASVDFHGTRLSLADTANRVALAKAIDLVGAKKVITFHSTVAEARAFVQDGGVGVLLPAFETYHVNGAQGAEDRDETIDRFARAQRSLISNARCLTEGVDIPAVDLVAFVDPKKSKVDIIQAIGRAMRKPAGSDKEVGYILLPVLIDADSDIDEAMRNADLSVMWDVLSALKDEDEVLDEAVRRAAGAAPGESSGLRDFVDVIGKRVDLDHVRHATEVALVEELADSFDFKLGLLRRFFEREGHVKVPNDHIENAVKLGQWVAWCRSQKETFPLHRRASLEAIPGWTWKFRAQVSSDLQLEMLQRFAEREGHTNVPLDHIEDGVKLGIWVINQRVKSKRENLPPGRKVALEAIPGWRWEHPRVPESGYPGVIFDRRCGNWVARVWRNGKTVHLGHHETAEAASRYRERWLDAQAAGMPIVRERQHRIGVSGYPFVSFHKQSGKYIPTVKHNGKNVRLGLRDTAEAANEYRTKWLAAQIAGAPVVHEPPIASSGFRGVTLDKRSGTWRARVRYNGKMVSLGHHATAEAASAYRAAWISAQAVDASGGSPEITGEA